MGGIRAAVGFN